jgi:hypothetical protein
VAVVGLPRLRAGQPGGHHRGHPSHRDQAVATVTKQLARPADSSPMPAGVPGVPATAAPVVSFTVTQPPGAWSPWSSSAPSGEPSPEQGSQPGPAE